MNIINQNREMTSRELYSMVQSPEIGRVKDHPGEEFEVKDFVIFEDVNTTTGETVQVLSIKMASGEVLATNSKTFIGSFISIYEMCKESGEPIGLIRIFQGKSKAGRDFFDCVLV